ncbi:DUF1338 domain-containing protein [Flocculibacter collagenilyticus]|uniref:DUF1338 domain-containing protein n=1 Tax=Flocculibacter collagenilyticus TaxID=2744479 RepID=UPI0018F290E0|nr:DUF1338 domain-containing protein [Flocculibacter collagenilyticus]
MHTNVHHLFDNLWADYISLTPSAKKVHEVLAQNNEDKILNDHVAFRTFNIAKVNLEKLAAHFLALGYTEGGEYHFEQKKLYAKHFEHEDKRLPKVFISELLVEEFSEELQAIVKQMVDGIDAELVTAENFLYSGTHWSVTFEQYKQLLQESEYAAWMAAYGFRANHFTVNINALDSFDCINEVNHSLKAAGFQLNTSGGEVKGSPEVLLEQSSTMADVAEVKFADKTAKIPSCFYEFAKRYNDKEGELYSGFVAASADKIFESTNAK